MVPLDTGVLKAAPLYQEFHSVERFDAHTLFLPISLLTVADMLLYRTQQTNTNTFSQPASLIKNVSIYILTQ